MSGIDRPRLALYIALALIVCVLGARYLRAEGIAVPAPPGASVGAGTGAGAGSVGGVSGAGGGAGGGDRAGSGAAASPAAGADAGAAAAGGVRIDRADAGVVVVHVAGAVRRPGLYRLPAGSRVDDALRRAGGPKRHADVDAVNLAAKLEDGRQILVPLKQGAAVAAAGTAAGAPGAPGGPPVPPVNLNTATAEQLDTLDGIGPGLAARILAYRTAHGGFRSVQELGDVSGIGDKRLATLRPLVTV